MCIGAAKCRREIKAPQPPCSFSFKIGVMMRKPKSNNFKRNPIAVAVALTLVAPLAINQANAGAGWGDNANLITKVQTFYANSPSGLRDAVSCYVLPGTAAAPVTLKAYDPLVPPAPYVSPGAAQPVLAKPVAGAGVVHTPTPVLDANGAPVPFTFYDPAFGVCDSGKALRKFVNALPRLNIPGAASLPGLPAFGTVASGGVATNVNGGPNEIGQQIPFAMGGPLFGIVLPALGIPTTKESWVTPEGVTTTDDVYEIAAVQTREQMHSDLPPVVVTYPPSWPVATGKLPGQAVGPIVTGGTELRGYVQIESDFIRKDPVLYSLSEHLQLFYPNGSPIIDPTNSDLPNHYVYAVHKPHYLAPTVVALKGNSVRFIWKNFLPYGSMTHPGSQRLGGEYFLPVDHTQQSAGVGQDGVTPYTDNRIAVHLHGGDAPWLSDGNAHQWFVPRGEVRADGVLYSDPIIDMSKGKTCANIPDMPDLGDGSYNILYPNDMSGRLMWYHDHASGITKLNAYAGEAAGYLLLDGTMINQMGLLPAAAVGSAASLTNTLPGLFDTIPLILQHKAFVPKDVALQDARWDETHWGHYGDLWFPHVYETNQDPNSIDGTNPVGRWDWGPWFWPVFPAQYSIPTGVYGDVTQTPEAFADTAMVNGVAYPTLTVEPKPYRLIWLNGSNDNFMNLGFYVADTTSAQAKAVFANTGVLGTEVPMVPFMIGATRSIAIDAAHPVGSTVNFPTTGGLLGTGWGPASGTDHAAGVPDPAAAGPDILQVGTEGGMLPQAVLIPSTPTNYEYNKRSATLLSVQERGLLLGNAMRADTVVDFTNFAGKILIVYDDAPKPIPAFDPRLDYYTGDPDYTGAGGAEPTRPGYGPNSRTMMRFEVLPARAAGTVVTWKGQAALIAATPVAYKESGQEAPFVPQVAYNAAFGTTDTNNYLKINSGSALLGTVTFGTTGAQVINGATISSGGNGYTTHPSVVFTPPPGATGSGAAAVVGAGIGGIVLSNSGSGYATPPIVTFVGGTTPDGVAVNWTAPAATYIANFQAAHPGMPAPTVPAFPTPGTAGAPVVVLNPVTGGIKSITIPAGFPGTFATMPTVTFAGGTAMAGKVIVPPVAKGGVATTSGMLNSITMTNFGSGYNAVPFVTFTGSRGVGAVANLTTTSAGSVTLPVRNKGIQELFDPIYGRMTATYSVELPLTTAITATTVPLAYIDENTEYISGRETQIWKVTHNGVDTHPVHFHMVNVQIVNRVGWDGSNRPPFANELGWRETVQMNPLEDIYIAVRPKPVILHGFGLPESVRLLDPAQPPGAMLGFSQWDLTGSPLPGGDGLVAFNPNFGSPSATPVVNKVMNFDNEYTWHCHILGHEEFDFMRPLVYHPFYQKTTLNALGLPDVDFGQWFEPSRTVGVPDQLAVPARPILSTVGAVAGLGNVLKWADNSTTEYKFEVERAATCAGPFAVIASTLANSTTYTDAAGVAGQCYQVRAVGAKGVETTAPAGSDLIKNAAGVAGVVMPGAPLTLSAAVIALNNSLSNAVPATVAALTPPIVPAVPVGAIAGNVVTLSWTTVPGATSYSVYINGVKEVVPVAGIVTTRTITGLAYGSNYNFTVTASKTVGAATAESAQSAAYSTYVSPTPSLVAGTLRDTSLTLTWPAVMSATNYILYQNGIALPLFTAANGGLPTYTANITGLTGGTNYVFTIAYQNAGGISQQSTAYSVTTVPTTLAAPPVATAVTSTGATLSWAAVAGATGYKLYIDGAVPPVLPSPPAVDPGVVLPLSPLSYTVSGLLAGTVHTYSMNYTTAAGVSALSPALTVVTTPAAPVATVVSDTSATLSWTPVAGATSYVVYKNGVPLPAVSAAAAQPMTITGLTPATSYQFAVSATVPAAVAGQVANSPQSAAASGVTLPSAPVAVNLTANAVTLNWAPVAGTTGYTVYQTNVTAGTPAVALTPVAGTVTTQVVSGLLANNAYSFSVAYTNNLAYTLQGSYVPTARSLPLSVTTPAAAVVVVPVIAAGAAPTPTATAVTTTGLTLNWTAVAGATGYVVYKNGVMLPAVAGVGTSQVITGLTTKTSYNFRVAYRNAAGVLSAPSAVFTGVTL
jgi:hypothetical protein